MLQPQHNEVRSFCLVLASISIALVMYGIAIGRSLPKAGPDQDWDEIMRLHKQGQEALAAEKSNPKDATLKIRRQAVFAQASTALTTYIDRYLSDKKTVTYLRAIYRLGNYLELAGFRDLAVGFYYLCVKHPLVKTKEAIYNGKPIFQLATDRLKAAAKLPKTTTTHGGASANISPEEQERIRKLMGEGSG